MLACGGAVPSHTIACTFIDLMASRAPMSVYFSCPDVAPVADDWAFPPKYALSPLLALIQPPFVIVTSQFGVVAGSTQVLVAAPEGSPASWVLLPLKSAYAVIASWPGSAGPV